MVLLFLLGFLFDFFECLIYFLIFLYIRNVLELGFFYFFLKYKLEIKKEKKKI